MTFKFEQQAYDNAPLPDNLAPHDVTMFVSLRAVYQQFKAGTITKEQAQKEKRKLEQIYDDLQQRLELNDQFHKAYNQIDEHSHAFSNAIKDRDCEKIIETAKSFYQAIYRAIPKWFEIDVDK